MGHVANLVVQAGGPSPNQRASVDSGGVSFGDQCVLVDLTGRPDLVAPARKAVLSFLDSANNKGSSSDRVQSTGSAAAFTVKLRTIVTSETRQEMINRGVGLLSLFWNSSITVRQTGCSGTSGMFFTFYLALVVFVITKIPTEWQGTYHE